MYDYLNTNYLTRNCDYNIHMLPVDDAHYSHSRPFIVTSLFTLSSLHRDLIIHTLVPHRDLIIPTHVPSRQWGICCPFLMLIFPTHVPSRPVGHMLPVDDAHPGDAGILGLQHRRHHGATIHVR